jgi:hypothetical protein
MDLPRCFLHLLPLHPAPGLPPPTLLLRWTPAWEMREEGVCLDLTGTDRLHGHGGGGLLRVCRGMAAGWVPVVGGAASTLLAAWLAARLAWEWSRRTAAGAGALLVVEPEQVSVFLAPFPLGVLADRHPSTVAALQRFGVRTLGDLRLAGRSLLAATLGPAGPALLAEVWGRGRRPALGARPTERTVVAARLARPLSGERRENSLRQALAVRALLACPEGPGAWSGWRLRVTRGGQSPRAATAAGAGPGTLAGWRQQIECLWRRLPAARPGITAVELLAGEAREPAAVQGSLFPGGEDQDRLARIWRHVRGRGAAGEPDRALFLASETLLERWGVRWSGPVVDSGRRLAAGGAASRELRRGRGDLRADPVEAACGPEPAVPAGPEKRPDRLDRPA